MEGPVLELYMVTGNSSKVREASAIIESEGAPVRLVQAGVRKLEIQSDRLEDIALHSARAAYSQLGRPVISEDSGLFIEALKGFPGPYSSYVYRTIGVEGVLRLMSGVRHRRACFRASIALVAGGLEKLFLGEACGRISEEPRGEGGFGFDPIFVPEGHSRTLAEMSVHEKNMVSHRGMAFRRLAGWLKGGGIDLLARSP